MMTDLELLRILASARNMIDQVEHELLNRVTPAPGETPAEMEKDPADGLLKPRKTFMQDKGE